MALFLSKFTCERCGRPVRGVNDDRDEASARALCATCGDELTAEAAARHDTLLWYHRRS